MALLPPLVVLRSQLAAAAQLRPRARQLLPLLLRPASGVCTLLPVLLRLAPRL